MVSVQAFIRAEVSRGASPKPKGANAFHAHAFACAKELIPEMEHTARLTLNHPMTFEVLGEGLRLFEGWALRDLVDFRKRCVDSLVTCLRSFLKVESSGPSSSWIGCPEVMPSRSPWEIRRQDRVLPRWLNQLLSQNQNDLKHQMFTRSLNIHSRIHHQYVRALRNHANCNFCWGVHKGDCSSFYWALKNKLVQARKKVPHSFLLFKVTQTKIHLP
jgi:hypothetical protein